MDKHIVNPLQKGEIRMTQTYSFHFAVTVDAQSEEEALRIAIEALEQRRQDKTLDYQRKEKDRWKKVSTTKKPVTLPQTVWTDEEQLKEWNQFTKAFADEYGCDETADISRFYCGDYGCFLYEYLQKEGQTHWRILSISDLLPSALSGPIADDTNLWTKDEMEKYGITTTDYETFRKQLLKKEPSSYVGYYVWLYDGNKHYDAECPKGTTNVFDLPFFQRFLT